MPIRCPRCATLYPSKYPTKLCWVCGYDFDVLRQKLGKPTAHQLWRMKDYDKRKEPKKRRLNE